MVFFSSRVNVLFGLVGFVLFFCSRPKTVVQAYELAVDLYWMQV